MPEIINLPQGFIGKDDVQRLESFGAHLISHGHATRWHWRRANGFDIAFEIFCGGMSERLLVTIVRDRKAARFVVRDQHNGEVAHGALDHVMAVVDKLTCPRLPGGDSA